MKNGMRRIHPGEVIREEYLKPLTMSAMELAGQTGIPPYTIVALLDERASITPDIAERLSKVLGSTVAFWLNLQLAYDQKSSP
jgi:addiction module HigA family antidote